MQYKKKTANIFTVLMMFVSGFVQAQTNPFDEVISKGSNTISNIVTWVGIIAVLLAVCFCCHYFWKKWKT